MAEVEVRNTSNDVVEQLSLADEVFDYSASETLVWEAVRAFLANQRKGTHSTKNRHLVRGGGRKVWKQKGTGRARVGSLRSPLWKGGGTVFGPTPRDYSQAFPKKKKRGAVKRVLSDKLKADRIRILDEFNLENPKTKDFLAVLDSLGLSGDKVLVVDDRENRNLYLGARNVVGVKMVPTRSVNVYDLLDHEYILMTKRAALTLQEGLQR